MAAIGRPEIGPKWDFHMPLELKERLRREAERCGVSMADLAREALDARLPHLEEARV